MKQYIQRLIIDLYYKNEKITKENIKEILNSFISLFNIEGYEVIFETDNSSSDVISKQIIIDIDELNELTKSKSIGEYNIFVLEVLLHEIIHIDNFNEISRNTKYKDILTFLYKDHIGYINAKTDSERDYYLVQMAIDNHKNIFSIHERITNIKTTDLLLSCSEEIETLKEYFQKKLNDHIISGYYFNNQRTNIKSIFKHYYGVQDFILDDYYSKILFGLELDLEDEIKLASLVSRPIKKNRKRF